MAARFLAASQAKNTELNGLPVLGLVNTYSLTQFIGSFTLTASKVSKAPCDKGTCLILFDLFFEIFQDTLMGNSLHTLL
jgi:hypothetical protein